MRTEENNNINTQKGVYPLILRVLGKFLADRALVRIGWDRVLVRIGWDRVLVSPRTQVKQLCARSSITYSISVWK